MKVFAFTKKNTRNYKGAYTKSVKKCYEKSLRATKTEAAVRRCSSKFMFLKKPQNSHDEILRSAFINIKNSEPCNFIKKSLRHRCFPANFAKCLRTTFFKEQLRCLLLKKGSRGLRRNNLPGPLVLLLPAI